MPDIPQYQGVFLPSKQATCPPYHWFLFRTTWRGQGIDRHAIEHGRCLNCSAERCWEEEMPLARRKALRLRQKVGA